MNKNYTKHCKCQSSPLEFTIFSCGSKPSLHREQDMSPAAIVVILKNENKFIMNDVFKPTPTNWKFQDYHNRLNPLCWLHSSDDLHVFYTSHFLQG